jgi:hypothetical protein
MNRIVVAACLFFLNAQLRSVAAEMPSVYGKEDTGANCAKPPLPEFNALPSIPYLPDPFTKADGSRMTTREEWRSRASRARSRRPSMVTRSTSRWVRGPTPST